MKKRKIRKRKKLNMREKIKITVPVMILWSLLIVAGYILFCQVWGRPELKLHVSKRKLPVSEDGYYEINSAPDFYFFWEEICDDDEYAKGRLMKDIYLNKISDDMGRKEWEKLRLYKGVEVFSGVFDGNGHTVYGVYSNGGYGLTMRNKGEIRNLSIHNSIICGGNWELIGGICKENSGVISKCDFGGELYIFAVPGGGGWLAGICSRNMGMVEQCGFSGTVDVDGEYFDGQVFGICAENLGEIVRCYNLADLSQRSWQPWWPKSYPAITDQGEKQCFVLKDSGWDLTDSGQTIAIKREQTAYIPFLVRGDIYRLLTQIPQMDESQEPEELLGDEVVSDLIMELIIAKGERWDNLSLETEVSKGSALLKLSDKENRFTIRVLSTWQEGAVGREEGDFEGLWQQCAQILGEKDAESFAHSSWQMVAEQEEEETVFGNLVLFQTDKGQQGFFLQKDQSLYQIESRGEQEEFSEIYRAMLRRLWDGRKPSVGISWRSEEIRKAALAELEAVREKEAELEQGADLERIEDLEQSEEQEVWERTPSREELYALESLSINKFGRISSLEDLSKMPHLKTLSFYGEGGSAINFDLKVGMLSELEKLTIDGVKLVNLNFLNQFSQLKSLMVVGCDVNDISGIQSCRKLEVVSLRNNHVKNIYPLTKLPELRKIDISNNEIITIESLYWIRQLNSLECSGNNIMDIYYLRYLQKLQYLDICNNQIGDFEPITGLTSLCYLDISGNPGQNIGDLIFLPQLILGNGIYGEQDEEQEQQEAQTILNLFYPQEELIAQDMVKGDLNSDGITDIVIAGLCEGSPESIMDDNRKIYAFLGKSDGTFQSIMPINTYGPEDGGVYGDPYNGMLITEGRLVVQVDICSPRRRIYTWVYEYEKEKMQEKWELELVYDVYESGCRYYTVIDRESQQMRSYVIDEDRQLLLE